MLYSNIVLKTVLCGAIIIGCMISVQSFAQQASLELQEKCARQAQTAFNNMQFQDRKLASFTNHYNVKLNRLLQGQTLQFSASWRQRQYAAAAVALLLCFGVLLLTPRLAQPRRAVHNPPS